MGIGIRKHKGMWVDRYGRYLPADNYHNPQPIEVDDGNERTIDVGVRITNPAVAKDIRSKSFTFGGMTKLAAKRFTNKRFKNKAKA